MAKNTTEKIRDLKHSRKIRESVTKIVNLKKYARLDKKNLRSIMENQCSFYMKIILIFLIKL